MTRDLGEIEGTGIGIGDRMMIEIGRDGGVGVVVQVEAMVTPKEAGTTPLVDEKNYLHGSKGRKASAFLFVPIESRTGDRLIW
jgi:hypothetical protein